MRAVLVPIAVGLVAAAGGGVALPATGAVLAPAPCTPAGLQASMTVIRGSAGAGQISYDVRLRNRGPRACTVSGRPGLRLLDRHGRALPTHAQPDRPGTGTAALVRLGRDRSAVAEARFSPDVPGPGEPTSGPCEPRAVAVRVTLASPGSGTVVGRVRPPTSVCEHGRIVLGLLHAAP
jgi:hypothetical protein